MARSTITKKTKPLFPVGTWKRESIESLTKSLKSTGTRNQPSKPFPEMSRVHSLLETPRIHMKTTTSHSTISLSHTSINAKSARHSPNTSSMLPLHNLPVQLSAKNIQNQGNSSWHVATVSQVIKVSITWILINNLQESYMIFPNNLSSIPNSGLTTSNHLNETTEEDLSLPILRGNSFSTIQLIPSWSIWENARHISLEKDGVPRK
jgi:hypothetical protein